MAKKLRKILQKVVRPMILRPKRVQFAALCTREENGQTQVLLITSRDTGRWVIPKGWPIDGLDGAGTAAQEAWEEAGVRITSTDPEPVGQFTYDKVLKDRSAVPVRTTVYRVHVKELVDEFPEAGQREREWVAPQEAAKRVHEPELSAILKAL